jgi:CRISPR/Cas system CSM-associated protein Csm2 small subunit
MSQVNHKFRMKTYREMHLDSAQWEKVKASIAAGKTVSGTINIKTPMTSVMAWAIAAFRAAGNEMPKGDDGKELSTLPAAQVTSMRNGLLDDVGLLYAQTSTVRVDGKEIPADVWFADKIKASKNKLHFRDFNAQLDAAAKADKKFAAHRGVQWEIAEPILKYSSGRKGKQKKSILKTIDEI